MKIARIYIVMIFSFLFSSSIPAIQTQEVDLGRAGSYDGTVQITRDAMGRMILRDNEVTTPTTLFSLWYPGAFRIEDLRTDGPAGSAPVSNGVGALSMTPVATQSDLTGKADKTISIAAGTGLT